MTATELIDLYFSEQHAVHDSLDRTVIARLFELLIETYESGGTVYACANGGNAGTLDHFACDFKYHPFVDEDKSRASHPDRAPLRFVNLAGSASELTGLTNDRGFDGVFAHALEGRVEPKDLLLAFSGSGNSANVLAAIEVAAGAGARVFSMSKGSGGRSATLADLALIVPGSSTFPGQTGANDNNFHFEDLALSLNHVLVGLLRQHLTRPRVVQ